MNQRFNFRIPMFTDKGKFSEFQYIQLGDTIESTLCGDNGEPQQYTGLKDCEGNLIYENDVLEDAYGIMYSCIFDKDMVAYIFRLKAEVLDDTGRVFNTSKIILDPCEININDYIKEHNIVVTGSMCKTFKGQTVYVRSHVNKMYR